MLLAHMKAVSWQQRVNSYRLETYVRESETDEKILYLLRKYLSSTNTHIHLHFEHFGRTQHDKEP